MCLEYSEESGKSGDLGRGQAGKVSEVWVLSQDSEIPLKGLKAFGQSSLVKGLTSASTRWRWRWRRYPLGGYYSYLDTRR